MKRWVAVWIVASLVMLTSPELFVPWHDHDHSDEHAHHHDSEASEDCFVCDFDLAAGHVPSRKIEPVCFESIVTFSEWIDQSLRSETFALFQHRGPPASHS